LASTGVKSPAKAMFDRCGTITTFERSTPKSALSWTHHMYFDEFKGDERNTVLLSAQDNGIWWQCKS